MEKIENALEYKTRNNTGMATGEMKGLGAEGNMMKLLNADELLDEVELTIGQRSIR